MESSSSFQCRICLEDAKEPVVTQCGHLYCWGCMNKWLSQNHSTLQCPVCKAGIAREKLVPIYVKDDSPDPRADGAPRPRPPREQPQPNPEYSRFSNFAQSPQFTTGFGLFPGLFGFTFTTTMNHNDPRADTLSKIMLIIGMLILLSILF